MKGSTGFLVALVGIVLAIFVLNIVVPIFKPMVVQQAYNSQASYNITLSDGTQTTLTPATTVSYTQVASVWDVALPIFNILAALGVMVLGIFYGISLFKHKE